MAIDILDVLGQLGEGLCLMLLADDVALDEPFAQVLENHLLAIAAIFGKLLLRQDNLAAYDEYAVAIDDAGDELTVGAVVLGVVGTYQFLSHGSMYSCIMIAKVVFFYHMTRLASLFLSRCGCRNIVPLCLVFHLLDFCKKTNYGLSIVNYCLHLHSRTCAEPFRIRRR